MLAIIDFTYIFKVNIFKHMKFKKRIMYYYIEN